MLYLLFRVVVRVDSESFFIQLDILGLYSNPLLALFQLFAESRWQQEEREKRVRGRDEE